MLVGSKSDPQPLHRIDAARAAASAHDSDMTIVEVSALRRRNVMVALETLEIDTLRCG